MSEYTPIPVHAAKQISQHFHKQIVVLVAFDQAHGCFHTATYGESATDKLQAAALGDILTQAAGGNLEEVRIHEDFRTVDAAESRRQVEVLTERLAAAMSVVEGFVNKWDATWIDPEEASHEWSKLHQQAKAVVSPQTGGPDHGS